MKYACRKSARCVVSYVEMFNIKALYVPGSVYMYLRAALAQCLLMLYSLLPMMIVMTSDVVKHECRAGYIWLLFVCYFAVTVLLDLC